MERRAFVGSAFGLVVLAAGVGTKALEALASTGDAPAPVTASKTREVLFVTADGANPPADATAGAAGATEAAGPVVRGGIEMACGDDPRKITGYYGAQALFNVDRIGAELIRMADGTRSIDRIATEAGDLLGSTIAPADVASFFVTLGQAGYLRNTVLVNLYQTFA